MTMMLAIRETKLYENLTYVPHAARSYYGIKNICHVVWGERERAPN